MFISTAYAQTGAPAGGGDLFMSIVPLILIFVVFWFFLIRPQQKKVKEHRAMVQALRRGDQVVTAGGILGRVTKIVDDNTAQVEIADGVRVKIVRSTITDVVSRGEPVRSEPKAKPSAEADEGDQASAGEGEGSAAPKKSLFSFGSKK